MKNLLSTYISNLKLDDVKKYINDNYDFVSDKEIYIIFRYIKYRFNDLYDNTNNVFDDLKKDVSSKCYDEIIKLINKYEYLKK